MKWHQLFALAILIILASCKMEPQMEASVALTGTEISVPQSTTAPPITTTYPSSSTLSITPSELPSSISMPTVTTTAQPGYITPPIILVCPENREVPLGELGLPTDLTLLLIPPDARRSGPITSGIMAISNSNPIPSLIQSTIPREGWENHSYLVSPSGHWIRYYSSQADGPGSEIWIGSVGGEQAWVISENANNWTIWVTDQEIVFTGMPDSSIDDYSSYAALPLFSINPFTMEIRELQQLPQGTNFLTYFTDNDVPYAIYYESLTSENLFIYNYNDNTSWSIFQWLVGEADRHNSSIRWSYTTEGEVEFHVVVHRQYGLDMAVGLSLDEIHEQVEYDDVMSRIMFPDNYPDTFTVGWNGETPIIIVRGYRYDPEIYGEQYVFDYEEMILWDYCIEEESWMMMDVSPDGNFIAYTFYNLDQNGHAADAREVVILNLESGYITRIPDFQAIGWGVVNGGTP
jgi:hypothetical protein